MGGHDEHPRCNHQVLVVDSGRAEPSLLCSCPAGLIHMHDCPVTMGLRCIHFDGDDYPPEAVDSRAENELREQLMVDYLSRSYVHRVRSRASGEDLRLWFGRLRSAER